MARLATLALLVLIALASANATCSIVGTWKSNGVIAPSPGLTLVINGTAVYDAMNNYHATGLTTAGTSDCLVTLTATYSFAPDATGNYSMKYYGGSWSLNTGTLCPLVNVQFQTTSPIQNSTFYFDPTCTMFTSSTSVLPSYLSATTSFAISAVPAAVLVFALLAALVGLY